MEQESISATRIGTFRVLRRLASGATTDVLLARGEGSDRLVALKVLLQQFRSDPAFEQAFVREADAYARLSHPAIVKLYDFLSIDGQFVMVLEYVDGLPLHKLRAMLSIGGEKVEDTAALFIASRVFEALAVAHAARDPATGEPAPVIHRDINPSNVLVPWDANVKVSDFGIAKAGGTQADTKMGFVKGTYGYLAPEQVKGESVTVRADVYSASLLLWELLARRKAIQRGAMSEVGVLRAMAQPEFPALEVARPDVDPLVRDAVRRGLAVNPIDRSITAEEMVRVLTGAMKEEEGRATLARAIARVRPSPGEAREANGSIPPVLFSAPPPPEPALSAPPPPKALSSAAPPPEPLPAAPAESGKPVPAVETGPAEPFPPAAVDSSPRPLPAPSGAGVAATSVVAPVAAHPVARPGRTGTPRRDFALVVVLVSALVGVAIVAFCLWSQEQSRPVVSVTASPMSIAAPVHAPEPPTPPPSAPARLAPTPTGSAAAKEPAPPAQAPVDPAMARVAAATQALASPSASPRVARAAGSDPEATAAGLGDIFTSPSAGGHRVFVDGRVMGQSPGLFRVRCGMHEIRVGGNGVSQPIDIPCGGSILVNPKWPPPPASQSPP